MYLKNQFKPNVKTYISFKKLQVEKSSFGSIQFSFKLIRVAVYILILLFMVLGSYRGEWKFKERNSETQAGQRHANKENQTRYV